MIRGSKYSCKIRGYDPIVDSSILNSLGVKPVKLPNGLENIDVFIIANNHKSYRNLYPSEILKRLNKPAIIYDSWRMLNADIFNAINEII